MCCLPSQGMQIHPAQAAFSLCFIVYVNVNLRLVYQYRAAAVPNQATTTYSISELAKEFDITTRTIRHYEEIGLLAPQRRGQTRIYRPADRTKLKLILRGKRLGFSLEQSRNIIEMYDPESGNTEQLKSLLTSIQQQRQHIEEQINDINLLMKDLDDAERLCQKSLGQKNTTSGH